MPKGDVYSSIEAFQFGDQNDKFIGNAAANVALGGGGNDILSGGSGKDELHGGAGADRIAGQSGSDNLWGAAGADTFTFAAIADAGDVIHDFNGSEDVFQFTANALGGGLIRGGKLIDGQTLIDSENPVAVASKGTFLFDTDTSALSWDKDGTGKAAPVVIATLTDVHSLAVDDFLFV
jgi:Ca2+-binding RTX toxin-like protein